MIRIPRSRIIQAAPASIALLVGIILYLLDRQTDSVYFMAHWMVLGENSRPVFGAIGNHLPTFIHVYAFILLTAIFVTQSRAYALPICIFWFIIDSLFEIAQVSTIAQWIARHVPNWFDVIPFLDNASDYFRAGTFDILDILSIAAGTLAAYLTIITSTQRTDNNVPHI